MKINIKKHLYSYVLLISLLFLGACSSHSEKSNLAKDVDLQRDFASPPESVQTAVYWYWISDNISKEGVIKDLHSMKEVGINRAFIGNIGLNDIPYGKVKMLTDEWWDIIHTALKTATELDIEIGMFNSPGWSQSGGPWIKAENAMRYLTSSEKRLNGPGKYLVKLDKPAEEFQDVKVVAYKMPTQGEKVLTHQNCSLRSEPSVSESELKNLFDANVESGIKLPDGKRFILDIKTAEPFTARSITIQTTKEPIHNWLTIQVKEDNGTYRNVCESSVNRVNAMLSVGFLPYAPISISFPETTAKEFRLIFDNTVQEGWPFPAANLNDGLSEIVLSSLPRVSNYAEKTFAKMHPTPLPYWKDYQWPVQPEIEDKSVIVKPSNVIDISKYMTEDGMLNWEVPEGEWVVMRMGMTPTGVVNEPASPEATGYEVDKMSREHVEKHFYGHMGELLRRIPPEDRKSFKVVVQDSYEKGGQNFTDGFLEEFEEVYGYDPLPFLPVYQGVVVGSQADADRFLWDMRRLVANKIAYDFVGGFRDVSHKHGLTTWLENYGHWGFPGEFLMYGGQSDEIGGEFWSEGSLGDIENRAATSCGHIYNKKKIWAESQTCAGLPFSRYPAKIKQRGDRFFAEGINSTLLHVYIAQPYEDKNPGMNAWFGNEFNRKNTWFSHIDSYIQYLKRVNIMLQHGLNVADAAYFIGEGTPKMTGVTDPPLPIGYEFDYMNAEVIEKYMTVKDGLLTLPHGTQYRIMVLPKLETMRPKVLKKIKELIHEGGVVLGPRPLRSPSLQNQPVADDQVKSMAADLWGEVDGVKVKSRRYGKGMILSGMDMKDALKLIDCIPDCKLPEDNSIHYGHRTSDYGNIYFISNQTDEEKIVTPEFRVTGLQPELWDATTGRVRLLPAYEQKSQSTAVPLKLAANESVFIVFRKAAAKSPSIDLLANYPNQESVISLDGPWEVQFNAAQRGPEEVVVFDKLIDLTESDNELIKYYSGTAEYTCTFTLSDISDDFILDLGTFVAMAKVKINGKDAGSVWTAPNQLNITDYVRSGENVITVELVNTWVNRIVGDMRLPEEERQIWMPANPYNADTPLQESGLIGPVRILKTSYSDRLLVSR